MFETASELYYMRTRKRCLYNIMPIENVDSVLERGILSHEKVSKLRHVSVALNSVQERRDHVAIPKGLKLHQYANLYFDYNNPMLYKLKDQAKDLAVLAVSAEVLDLDGCVISDMNAAKTLARFYDPYEGMQCIDFDRVFAQYWGHDDYYEYLKRKAIKCAEVLIPDCVKPQYIVGAYVVNQRAADKMKSLGFDKPIHVRPKVFYR